MAEVLASMKSKVVDSCLPAYTENWGENVWRGMKLVGCRIQAPDPFMKFRPARQCRKKHTGIFLEVYI